MFAEHDRISYSRLMDAAEAALHASLQAADDRGGETVMLGEHQRSPFISQDSSWSCECPMHTSRTHTVVGLFRVR
ncbi:MAG: hypothetical protein AAFX05_04810, partial [Planctomycetota bacterium]